jgi:hypothetical protein
MTSGSPNYLNIASTDYESVHRRPGGAVPTYSRCPRGVTAGGMTKRMTRLSPCRGPRPAQATARPKLNKPAGSRVEFPGTGGAIPPAAVAACGSLWRMPHGDQPERPRNRGR